VVLAVERDEALPEARRTVRPREDDLDACACPLRLTLTRRLKENGEEARDFLAEELPGQVAYAPKLRHLALHVGVTPLETPPMESRKIVAAPPSIAHHGHNPPPHRRRQTAKRCFPITSSFFARAEYEEGGKRVSACKRTEEHHEATVPTYLLPERKPERVGNRHQGNVRGKVLRVVTLEQKPEALVKPLAEHLTMFAAACGEAAEGEGAPEYGAGEGGTRSFRLPAPPPRAHRPRGAARGAPPSPGSVGAHRSAATM
jgi:hypothetical protein